jgi:hypothetical protein
MCRVDFDGERPSVYSTARPVARKAYACGECGRTIAPGERYVREFQVFDGDPLTFFRCAHCDVGAGWLVRTCAGYIFGEILEDLEEHAGDYPAIGAELRAFVAAARAKWAVGAGLAPIPPALPELRLEDAA